MGWWAIKNGCLGDGPADIMSIAIKEIKQEYQRDWKRDPSNDEIKGLLRFCLGGAGHDLGVFNPVNRARAKKTGRKPLSGNLIPGVDSSKPEDSDTDAEANL